MTDDVTIEIVVSSEDIAIEVGYGILGRAIEIHENPDDELEDVAVELKDTAREVLNDYES